MRIPKPALKIEGNYKYFVNENFLEKYDVDFIRLKNDDLVDYYLKINGNYYLIIDDVTYKQKEIQKLNISDEFENTYIDIFVYENNQNLDTLKMYYSSSPKRLYYLDWFDYQNQKIKYC